MKDQEPGSCTLDTGSRNRDPGSRLLDLVARAQGPESSVSDPDAPRMQARESRILVPASHNCSQCVAGDNMDTFLGFRLWGVEICLDRGLHFGTAAGGLGDCLLAYPPPS